MEEEDYYWAEDSDQKSGTWKVRTFQGRADIEITDCGCCGSVDVLNVCSVEEFDAEWDRIGKMLRTHVRRATRRGEER